MITTAPPTPSLSPTATLTDDRHATRSPRDDLAAIPTVLRSEWIKLSSLRANKTILGLTVGVNALASWAVATLVKDEVLTASQVFIYPALLTAVFAAVTAILLFSTEVQHGTLAGTLTAQPARWVIAVTKTMTATAAGFVLGAVGMAAGFVGAVAGGLDVGDTSAMASRTLWTLLYTSLAAVIGLGLAMIVRHSAGAISGLLVWWFVVENLIHAFAPARVGRFLPFDAGYRLLDVGSDLDSAETIAVALTRVQCALVFGGFAALTLIAGTVLLHRRDPN